MTTTKDHHVPPAVCPVCGATNTGAMSVGHTDPPSPGDATICGECGTWSLYTEGLDLRKASDSERITILASVEAQKAEWAVLEVMRDRS